MGGTEIGPAAESFVDLEVHDERCVREGGVLRCNLSDKCTQTGVASATNISTRRSARELRILVWALIIVEVESEVSVGGGDISFW